jgi:hypothetical protein
VTALSQHAGMAFGPTIGCSLGLGLVADHWTRRASPLEEHSPADKGNLMKRVMIAAACNPRLAMQKGLKPGTCFQCALLHSFSNGPSPPYIGSLRGRPTLGIVLSAALRSSLLVQTSYVPFGG